ncbi:Methylated-DNA--protein-cysteine methyltransferase [Burkholderiales bacterium]|nr:Methylated-DNA--protein-cysteine methyltransferase [Burkholderiales bacterium]
MNEHVRWCRRTTPLGTVRVVARGNGIAGIYFDGQKHDAASDASWREAPDDPLLAAAARQLDEYFAGRRRRFDVAIAPRGTPFQRAVWRAIAAVPAGETATYGELARRIGKPTSARAVGAAVGRNPLSIVVPCHRIVGAGGALTGYAGGLARKRALLAHEHVALDAARDAVVTPA